LVDDGSTDSWPEICDKWSLLDKRIKTIHKQNGGLSEARKYGLDISTGEYIVFIDSDDYIDKTMIEVLYKAIKKDHTKIALCDFYYKDGDRLKPPKTALNKPIMTGKELLEHYLKSDSWSLNPVWNKIYHKSVFDKLRFPVGRLYEDGYVNYILYGVTDKISIISDALYYYVKRKGSITQTPDEQSVTDLLDRDDGLLQFVNKHYPDLNKLAASYSMRTYLCVNGMCQINKDLDVQNKKCNAFLQTLKQNPYASWNNPYLRKKDMLKFLLIKIHLFKTVMLISWNIRITRHAIKASAKEMIQSPIFKECCKKLNENLERSKK
jgi:glycosyltransferase involved in cell wall biosynthesis